MNVGEVGWEELLGAMGVVADEKEFYGGAKSRLASNQRCDGWALIGGYHAAGEFYRSRLPNTNGGGFASIRVPASNLLFGEATGVRLRVRGDGHDYTFRLRPRNSRISYWSQFATEDGEWLR